MEDSEPTVVPRHGPLTEVIGRAKAQLKEGTVLEGGGGFTLYAENDLAVTTTKEQWVPFGLLEGAKLLRNIEKDDIITYDMVDLKTDTMVYYLRSIQDQIIPPTNLSS